jgi:hypothetical protein
VPRIDRQRLYCEAERALRIALPLAVDEALVRGEREVGKAIAFEVRPRLVDARTQRATVVGDGALFIVGCERCLEGDDVDRRAGSIRCGVPRYAHAGRREPLRTGGGSNGQRRRERVQMPAQVRRGLVFRGVGPERERNAFALELHAPMQHEIEQQR